jgi:hypothetical protein
MMFTIDLLKGQGVPIKIRPLGIAIALVTVALPFIIAITMFGFYLNNKILITVKRQEMTRCQTEIDELSDAVKIHKSFEKQKVVYNECLSEVKSSLSRYVQWSHVLVTLIEELPDTVKLTGLEVKEHYIRKKVPREDNPQEQVDINVPVKTLRVIISGSPQHNCDQAVKDFQDDLRSSPTLGPKLENIIVSQESGILEGQDVASYEIDCVFKSGL